MYRLTISGPIVQTIRNKWKQTLPQWIRIYRWANVWGGYCKDTDEWSCEIRKRIGNYDANETMAVLETTEALDILAPPYDIDDCWEEEVLQHGNHSCGNLLVLTGMPGDILLACKEYDIPFENWLRQYIQEEPIQTHKPARARRVCHIVEE
jgi:hypothetical protein